MSIKYLLVAFMILFSHAAISQDSSATKAPAVTDEVQQKILTQKAHSLKLSNYERNGDAEKCHYILDGVDIGIGSAGYKALCYIISKMPKGCILSISTYFGGGGFPFKEHELLKYAENYGVIIGIPQK